MKRNNGLDIGKMVFSLLIPLLHIPLVFLSKSFGSILPDWEFLFSLQYQVSCYKNL